MAARIESIKTIIRLISESVWAMGTKLLTTGQAAKYCSVTPDTVLKWVRSGVLPARRTAGGHHRIDERDLQRVLRPWVKRETRRGITSGQKPFRYCWEFNTKGDLLEACRACPAYQMRAQRCYQVVRLAPGTAHPKLFCKRGSCLDCDYYLQVHGQAINVLVVSDDEELTGALRNESDRQEFNLQITNCEYSCSAAINEFRPDFAVIDCSMGSDLSREIVEHLSEDPRIPFVRVVLAANEGEFPAACDKKVFARLQRPFSVHDIASCIKGVA